MTKFKVGDLVVATQFDGATGEYLSPDKIYRVLSIEKEHTNCLLTLEGEITNSGDPLKAYDRRFILHNSQKMDAATEYEEAMEFDRLVNG